MSNLRIAIISPQYPSEPVFGGVGVTLHTIASGLVKRGHDCHVFTSSADPQLELEMDGVRVHRVGRGRVFEAIRRRTRRVPLALQTARSLDFSARAWRRLRVLHRRDRFDVAIYANTYASGLFSSLFTRIPFAVWIGSYRPLQHSQVGIPFTLDSRIVTTLENLQLRVSRNTWVPSLSTLKAIQEAGYRHLDLVKMPIDIGRGIEASSVKEALKGLDYVVFFGRFQEVKGFHVLAEAMPRVFANDPELNLVCIGKDQKSSQGDSLLERLKQRSQGFEERLSIMDSLPQSELFPIIRAARASVLPSLSDNLPNAGLESLALGTPVVGTLGTGFEEIVEHGRTGLLVPPGDADSLASSILEIWNLPDRERIRNNCRESVTANSADLALGEIESQLNRVREVRKR